MKKALYLLLAILLLSQLYCDDTDGDYCDGHGASSVDECQKYKFNEDDVDGDGNPYKYCCYSKAEADGKTKTECISLTQKDYDDIDDFIDDLEKLAKDYAKIDADYSVDCSSNYIMISLLSLIVIFFIN